MLVNKTPWYVLPPFCNGVLSSINALLWTPSLKWGVYILLDKAVLTLYQITKKGPAHFWMTFGVVICEKTCCKTSLFSSSPDKCPGLKEV